MSDDTDDELLRRAMKSLDDQVPAGYFDQLPQRTLARLETSMQTSGSEPSGTSSSSPAASSTGVPPRDKDDDSGLHDIRGLAASTKARLSSRRSTQNPIIDEDVLAASSAGWKAVALPEPAKMVSLPELADRPSKREIKEKEKEAAKKAKAAEAAPAAPVKADKPAVAADPKPAPAAKAAVAVAAVTPITARAAKPKSHATDNRTKTLAILGIGLAAAAGVVLFVATRSSKSDEAAPVVAAAQPDPAPVKAVATPIAVPQTVPPPADPVPPPPPPAEVKPDPVVAKPAAPPVHTAKGNDSHAVHLDLSTAPKDPPDVKPAKPKDEKKPGSGDPSFDDLLKEAGVDGQKKEAKVHLDKKSLSGADIMKGMGAVERKAQACYAGTQGTAAVKLTVLPTGQIEKLSVSGAFAGTPVADCVMKAVKGTSFPPWDGGPQSFNYSYLLSE